MMFRHKKNFGQNFLINKEIIKKIVNIANITKDTNIIEVGPGMGSLTKIILKKNPKKLHAIEYDKDLIDLLEEIKNNHINFEYEINDALNVNEKNIFEKNVIIFGNLPYNISLKLLIKWIYSQNWPPFYSQMILMFQREVADRIIANCNNKKYGRISILTHSRLEVKFHFNVSKKEFSPEPKVDSSVLSFYPKEKSKFTLKDLNILSELTKTIFNNKRKMISKVLKKKFNEEELVMMNFDKIKNLRPENLDFDFYYKLLDIIKRRS
jgi:16S rRNA (adenine1518-N6/adenine1519-N6)-dimethyltransferase